MNHYERLGVARDVELPALRRAYRSVAKQHHPDRHQHETEQATRQMSAINQAFEVLSDPARRRDYDLSLARAPTGDGAVQRPPTGPTPPAPATDVPRRPPPPADDPVRRARREAKERAAAEAKQRGYRRPDGGPSDLMNFSSKPKR